MNRKPTMKRIKKLNTQKRKVGSLNAQQYQHLWNTLLKKQINGFLNNKFLRQRKSYNFRKKVTIWSWQANLKTFAIYGGNIKLKVCNSCIEKIVSGHKKISNKRVWQIS
jgi:hypothetical protein